MRTNKCMVLEGETHEKCRLYNVIKKFRRLWILMKQYV